MKNDLFLSAHPITIKEKENTKVGNIRIRFFGLKNHYHFANGKGSNPNNKTCVKYKAPILHTC